VADGFKLIYSGGIVNETTGLVKWGNIDRIKTLVENQGHKLEQKNGKKNT